MFKTCPKCIKSKPLFKFTAGDNRCKKCLSKKAKKYRKTKKGWLSVVWYSQRQNSSKRNHPLPNYSKEELFTWVQSQENWKKLWKGYKKSGFVSGLKPSLDRLRDCDPYSLDNIRIITWDENQEKEWSRHKEAKSENNKDCVKVDQFDRDGVFLNTYDSMAIAQRKTTALQPNIHKVCNGLRKTAGGFIWRYHDED